MLPVQREGSPLRKNLAPTCAEGPCRFSSGWRQSGVGLHGVLYAGSFREVPEKRLWGGNMNTKVSQAVTFTVSGNAHCPFLDIQEECLRRHERRATRKLIKVCSQSEPNLQRPEAKCERLDQLRVVVSLLPSHLEVFINTKRLRFLKPCDNLRGMYIYLSPSAPVSHKTLEPSGCNPLSAAIRSIRGLRSRAGPYLFAQCTATAKGKSPSFRRERRSRILQCHTAGEAIHSGSV
jgi:hypothetical protein